MENQQVTLVVTLDLSAAFNTVDHELLLQVLHIKFGISGSAPEQYSTYLNQKDSEYVSMDATHQKKQCTSVYPKDQYREPSY